MSFRNISKSRGSIRVARNRDRGRVRSSVPSPNDNFRPFSQRVYDFAVENWVAVILASISGIAAGILGYYIGKNYAGVNVGKDIVEKGFSFFK